MKKSISVGFALLTGLALYSAAQQFHTLNDDKAQAFQWVLSYTQPQTLTRWSKIDKRQPFLFFLWLPDGNPKAGYQYTVFTNGRDWGDRLLYNYAVQGGDGYGINKTALKSLLRVKSLPQGLSNASVVSPDRFLGIGLRHGSQWQTRFYDRQNLPAAVRSLILLTKRQGI